MGNIYKEKGYFSRRDYLRSLADEYDLPDDVVYQAAEVLGPSEDFDGLLSMLEDAQEIF